MNLLPYLLLFVAVVFVSVLAVRAIGGDLRLIADWKKAWTFYSTWAFVVLGALPDIYNALISSGLFDSADSPEGLTWSIRAAALAGLLLRLVRQYRPPLPGADTAAAAPRR